MNSDLRQFVIGPLIESAFMRVAPGFMASRTAFMRISVFFDLFHFDLCLLAPRMGVFVQLRLLLWKNM